jgi:ElaB/YqjD/DUF883 family membrane-anchored ribosome-binding protein
MSKGILSPLFPATQRDVSRLKQTATDAVNDFSSTATGHVSKVSGQLRNLADHLQEEGSANFNRAQRKLVKFGNVARDFAYERPLVCIGVALAVGFLFGLSRRRRPAPETD